MALFVLGLFFNWQTGRKWEAEKADLMPKITAALEAGNTDEAADLLEDFKVVSDPFIEESMAEIKRGTERREQEAMEKRKKSEEAERLAREEKLTAARLAEVERLANRTPDEVKADEVKERQRLRDDSLEEMTRALHDGLGAGEGIFGGGEKTWEELEGVRVFPRFDETGKSAGDVVEVKFRVRVASRKLALFQAMESTVKIFEVMKGFENIERVRAWSLVEVVDDLGKASWVKGTLMELDSAKAREVVWDNLSTERQVKVFEKYGECQVMPRMRPR